MNVGRSSVRRQLVKAICLLTAVVLAAGHHAAIRAGEITPGVSAVGVEEGQQRPVVDAAGWVVGIPGKLLLWDRRVSNHDVSPETTNAAVEYLGEHHVDGVLVRVNQYDPFGEWRRLHHNTRVGAGWRYTVGAVYTLGYTILPGRIFGRDAYNPYTDTVSIYSDVPALALEQAAYAHDVHGHQRPGGYATVQSLPIAGLWHETRNKQDVYSYLRSQGRKAELAEARCILDPQLGTEVGGEVGALFAPAQGAATIAGAVVGHVTGRRPERDKLGDGQAEVVEAAYEPHAASRPQ
ncbi:MAG: hypothetical protein K1X74_19115 [Pirellulales bacterium]|nr:hypothetical protein [Pirellulales bacterium]